MKRPVTLSLVAIYLAVAAFVLALIVSENWFFTDAGLYTSWIAVGLALFAGSFLLK